MNDDTFNIQRTDIEISLLEKPIDLIHYTRHLCTRFRIDGIKAMSRGISEGKQKINFPIQVIIDEFVYSLKTRRRFDGQAKSTGRISSSFTSILLAVRTYTVATASKTVKMVTYTYNLPLSFLR